MDKKWNIKLRLLHLAKSFKEKKILLNKKTLDYIHNFGLYYLFGQLVEYKFLNYLFNFILYKKNEL